MAHNTVYQSGHPSGAPHNCGPASVVADAINGPTHTGSPRRAASASRPAAIPATTIAIAARNNATCQPMNREKEKPSGGTTMPRARSRSNRGPSPASTITVAAACHRLRNWPGARCSAISPSRVRALVSISAARFAVNGPPKPA